ncbi:hypothetical protein ABKV19_013636 [Rosa sericea]
MGRRLRRFVGVSGEAEGSLQQCFESNDCFHYSGNCASEVAFKGLGDFSKKELDSDSEYESETEVVEPTNEDELALSKLGLPQWRGIFSPFPIQAVIEKTNLNPKEVGDIVVGTVLAPGSQRASECRMAAFYDGMGRGY